MWGKGLKGVEEGETSRDVMYEIIITTVLLYNYNIIVVIISSAQSFSSC